MNKKFYIVITPFFPSEESFRGPFVYDQVNAIRKSGKYAEVMVFKPYNYLKKASNSYEYKGIKVYTFPTLQLPSYIFNGITNNINAYFFKRHIKKLGINISDIAVVHGHTSSFGIYGVSLKRINRNIISIVQHHDPDPYTIRNGRFSLNKLNLYVRASINRKLFEKIDLHVSVSKYVEQNLKLFPYAVSHESEKLYMQHLKIAQSLKLKPANIKDSIVLYNGIDYNKFHINGTKERNNDIFTIGCVGNFMDWKDQITLLKAINILIDKHRDTKIRVLFIGSGPCLYDCKKYVSEHELNNYVSFLNEIDNSLLIDFYNSLDLFVLPSNFEGFGCVFAESYACGVPFIAVKGQGISELIPENDIDKWLINKEDFVSLAKHIENYMQYRYKQTLKYDINIDLLIKDFIDYIDKK